MDDYSLKYLWDADQAAGKIIRFVAGRTIENYQTDDMFRSAVERQFEILGEALNRLKKHDEKVFHSIRGSRGAISFRNLLAHQYDTIDDILVWGVIVNDLPKLKKSVENLLK